ncbi:hypothetical protein WH95_19785 [Kiloniella litopenaei]|uniref:N-acetyltransferase domain-containing protein n=1 Tax=Kiloniella litopenaei TaxID=1549748 RepID=A0A0M2R425_9PROT|nr:hypothetical protein [Kiloniella litopenaei]KKJ75164.1 hypothetical protein WH95_19785 [Kiloniella litopenaei]
MVTFKDKQGRNIEIKEEGNNIVATHNNNKAGDLELTECYDLGHGVTVPPTMRGVFTYDDYKNSGIAEAMVRYASEMYGPINPGKINTGQNHDDNSLTDEGEGFTREMQKRGLINPFN